MWEYPVQVCHWDVAHSPVFQWPEMYPTGGNSCHLSPMYWFRKSVYQPTGNQTRKVIATLRAWKLLRSMHWSFLRASHPKSSHAFPKSPDSPKKEKRTTIFISISMFKPLSFRHSCKYREVRYCGPSSNARFNFTKTALFQGLGQLRVVVIQPDGMSSSKMTCHTLRDGMSWGMRLSLPETKLGKARWLKFDCDHCASYKKAVKTQRTKKYRKCIKIYTIYK